VIGVRKGGKKKERVFPCGRVPGEKAPFFSGTQEPKKKRKRTEKKGTKKKKRQGLADLRKAAVLLGKKKKGQGKRGKKKKALSKGAKGKGGQPLRWKRGWKKRGCFSKKEKKETAASSYNRWGPRGKKKKKRYCGKAKKKKGLSPAIFLSSYGKKRGKGLVGDH